MITVITEFKLPKGTPRERAIENFKASVTRYPGFPAVLFRRVGDSGIPLLINLVATYERLALSIGTDVHGMVPGYARREGSPLPTAGVGDAPVPQAVWEGAKMHGGR